MKSYQFNIILNTIVDVNESNKVLQTEMLFSDFFSVPLMTRWHIKVIPLKLFYYQTFFETWHNQHS